MAKQREYYTNFFSRGEKIYVRGVIDGRRYKNVVDDWVPTIYQKSRTPTGILSIKGDHLSPIQVSSIREARDKIKSLEGSSIVHGYNKFANCWAAETFDADKVASSWSFDEISVLFLDIETEVNGGRPDPIAAAEPINIVTVHDTRSKTRHVFASGDWTRSVPDRTYFYRCKDEADLLEKLLSIWERIEPDVVTGWNVDRFDVVYLIGRITKILGERAAKRLSPWGRVGLDKAFDDFGKDTLEARVEGVAIIDMMAAYKKFVLKPRESYSLDHISQVELKKTKLRHVSGIPGHLLYRTDFSAAIDYNVEDVQLVIDLEQKLNLVKLIFTIAYSSLSNYDDVWSQIRIWTNIIYLHLRSQNKFFPVDNSEKIRKPIVGGYVKPPLTGRKRYVVSADMTSEYPSLIMAFNMSTETLIQSPPFRVSIEEILRTSSLPPDVSAKVSELNACVAANGHMFVKSKHGFMAEITKRIFTERSMYKKKMLTSKRAAESGDGNRVAHEEDARRFDLIQNARKVQMNSLYGAMGNEHFMFYDYRVAEAITTCGQLIIQWVARDVNKFLADLLNSDKDRIIAIDTDSIYIDLEDLAESKGLDKLETNAAVDEIDAFCKTALQDAIDASLKSYCSLLSAYEPEAMNMKREAIATAGVFTAKKRYALDVIDNEGVRFQKPELKSMGLAVVQSKTPEHCKRWMKEIIPVIVRGGVGSEANFHALIDKFREEQTKMSPDQVAIGTGVSKVNEYDAGGGNVVKSTPIGSRAAIVHNHMVTKLGISERVQLIEDGAKIKMIQLKKHNPTGFDLMGFSGSLPEEFGLHEYIDREAMFEKTFLDGIKPLAHAVGWETVQRSRLDL